MTMGFCFTVQLTLLLLLKSVWPLKSYLKLLRLGRAQAQSTGRIIAGHLIERRKKIDAWRLGEIPKISTSFFAVHVFMTSNLIFLGFTGLRKDGGNVICAINF